MQVFPFFFLELDICVPSFMPERGTSRFDAARRDGRTLDPMG